MTDSAFAPNWASPPGETISDVLRERGMSVESFADAMRASVGDAQDLIYGRLEISIATARQLSKLLGSTVEFWVSRDLRYRKFSAQFSNDAAREWVRQLPFRDMTRFGWVRRVQPCQEVGACLRFFGVKSVDEWHHRVAALVPATAFRTSSTFESNAVAVSAWLRQGEILASKIATKRWDKEAFLSALQDVRKLTKQKDPAVFLPAVVTRCAAAGVAVVIVRAPNGCRASGATRFLTSSTAILQLSFRYLSDDQFWFTFFHEAGHLVLHAENRLFLEGIVPESEKEEKEASDFAEQTLIPEKYRREMQVLRPVVNDVVRFATRVGIAPGIVVGQLQHYGRVKRNFLNGLKRRYQWNED